MPIFKILLAISALLAIGYQLKTKKFSLVVGFILVIAILELFVARYFMIHYKNNYLIYTIISYLSVLFYLLYFRIDIKHIKMFRAYLVLFVFWQIFTIWNLVWGDGRNNANVNAYNLGMIISVFLVIRWFYKKLYIDDYEQLFYKPMLYVGFGILLFYTCSFPILSSINTLVISEKYNMIYANLLQIGNIFLSLGYLGAILCKIRKTYYTTS